MLTNTTPVPLSLYNIANTYLGLLINTLNTSAGNFTFYILPILAYANILCSVRMSGPKLPVLLLIRAEVENLIDFDNDQPILFNTKPTDFDERLFTLTKCAIKASDKYYGKGFRQVPDEIFSYVGAARLKEMPAYLTFVLRYAELVICRHTYFYYEIANSI